MNFLTVLPKNQPKVSYIVASSQSKEIEKQFRMHIVWDVEKKLQIKGKLLVLCHLLEVPQCESYESGYVNI